MTDMSVSSRHSMAAHSNRTRIAGLVSCIPAQTISNDSMAEQFGEAAEQIIKMTGVRRRHIAAPLTTTSDLCVTAAQRLFAQLEINAQAIDAIIFCTQTPDYRLPATACSIQHRLGLRNGIAAFDINLGCSAYPYALWLGSMMIETGAASKVLLVVGDTISKIVDPADRATALLFGDAGTATLLVHDENTGRIEFVLGSDGSGARNLIVPDGCFRSLQPDDRNTNAPDKLFMDGGEIFSFTLKAVPVLFAQLCEQSRRDPGDYDFVLFHQANQFMISHLRKKMKLEAARVPVNIARFGNTSSASIPLLMCTETRDALVSAAPVHLALLGFGVGYSWAAASLTVNQMQCADLIET